MLSLYSKLEVGFAWRNWTHVGVIAHGITTTDCWLGSLPTGRHRDNTPELPREVKLDT